MGKCMKIVLAAALIAGGYYLAKHETQAREVAVGLCDKGADVAKAPLRSFYNWATDRNIETVLQDNYQSKTNQESNIETNVDEACGN